MYKWTFCPRQPPPLGIPRSRIIKIHVLILYFNHQTPNHRNIARAIQKALELSALLFDIIFVLSEHFWPKQYELFCGTCKGALSNDGLNTFRRVWLDLGLNKRMAVYNYSLENSLFFIRKINWRAFKELKNRTEIVPVKSKYNPKPQSLCFILVIFYNIQVFNFL